LKGFLIFAFGKKMALTVKLLGKICLLKKWRSVTTHWMGLVQKIRSQPETSFSY
jgi:hypothetical protein